LKKSAPFAFSVPVFRLFPADSTLNAYFIADGTDGCLFLPTTKGYDRLTRKNQQGVSRAESAGGDLKNNTTQASVCRYFRSELTGSNRSSSECGWFQREDLSPRGLAGFEPKTGLAKGQEGRNSKIKL
jgi:hypothetical protein